MAQSDFDILNSLKDSKNLILQGAPGTGKTYITRKLAVCLCDNLDVNGYNNKYANNGVVDRKRLIERYNELVSQNRIAFTTFHQSLDYEDFVEGLKPDLDTNGKGTGTYSPHDGIFKAICNQADSSVPISNDQLFDWAWDELLKNPPEEIKQKQGGICQITGIDNGEFVFKNNAQRKGGSKVNEDLRTKKQTIKTLYLNFPEEEPNNLRGKKYRDATNRSAYTTDWAFYKMVRDFINTNKDTIPKIKQPYILIIDEINRANISKVLGELITLIEPSKRLGEDDEYTVTLPYSGHNFGVPNNLYILGTMNTADRSLGSIDYAIRRRFAFETLCADDSILNGKAKTIYANVKQLIEDTKDEDFELDEIMVGHSYFLGDINKNLEKKIIP